MKGSLNLQYSPSLLLFTGQNTHQSAIMETRASKSAIDHSATLDKFLKYKCNRCYQPLDSYQSTVQHFWVHHRSTGYAYCCSKKFTLKCLKPVLGHIAKHLAETFNAKHPCEQCPKVLSSQKELKMHIKTDHKTTVEQPKISCPICPLVCKTKAGLLHHIRMKHEKTDTTICCRECNMR